MVRTLTPAFDLYPAQYDFVHSQTKFSAFIGGIGSGKTYAGAVKALIVALNEGGVGEIVAPTYPMMRDVTARMFLAIAGDSVIEFNRSEMRATLATGAEVLFRSADDPERLRGANLTWLWIDEAAQVVEDAWLILLGRLRVGRGLAWITTTPKGKAHWTYRVFGKADAEHSLFRATTRDNRWLPASYLESVEQAYSGAFARQELGGEFVDLDAGDEFRAEWFPFIDRLPDGVVWQVRAWDLALTEKKAKGNDPDYTATCLGCADQYGNVYLGDPLLMRRNAADVMGELKYKIENEPVVRQGVGNALHEKALRDLLLAGGMYLEPLDESGDKHARIRVVVLPLAKQRRIRLIGSKETWHDWLDQFVSFPNGHDDAPDVVEKIIRMLGLAIEAKRPEIKRPERSNPYAAFGVR